MRNNFIDGVWLPGFDGRRNINPSDTADVIDEYAQADEAQTRQAVSAARRAFPGWSRCGIQARADALDFIGSELRARREELGRLLSREEGKTLPEGIAEVTRAAQIFRFFAGEVVRSGGETLPSVRPGLDVHVTREPVGVVGIITPWNFPIAIPAWKIAPALAYGNCVVFKPADLVPGSAWALTEIISRSGLPEGVFNLVMGRGSVVGQTLLEETGVDAISFTGSVNTGQRVMATAGARFAKLQLEMGGKNPLVVLADADLDQAAEVAVQGAYFSTGQRCTASSRFIVEKAIYSRFVDAVQQRLAGLKVDHALESGTDIGPVVDQSQLDQDLDYVAIGRDEGARLVHGGERLNRASEGFYMAPALFADTDPAMRIAREEIFGPVACAIPADNYEHALMLANDSPFGLSAGICTTSLKYASHFRHHAEAGMVMVNVPTAGVDYHVPFGGRKGSSYGSREQGRYAVEFFTTVKTAYVAP
ncbi:Aldehyde dehydrogenase family protein [Alloalcanivorax dieselolei B5]|uniref:Aldehyde dehydrogenase family protein n=1 Tax=Alcanivorax dieselolei (strain DSM 16502 / CGMCC 1.3690 / MCCC 1A00001 / B-5) TaxID=930169 RepID=K0C817_ALCDB|nr:aldehyde dehydrogenase family protein [Alloalcanivorax dieselolei]AFT69649.1 Aldehyde dehydrogenase family protein [Alloalcanivorax dieselolei B5]GGK03453.1 aldehyde dehydrogenase [Alloalcanivorax dieselolei]